MNVLTPVRFCLSGSNLAAMLLAVLLSTASARAADFYWNPSGLTPSPEFWGAIYLGETNWSNTPNGPQTSTLPGIGDRTFITEPSIGDGLSSQIIAFGTAARNVHSASFSGSGTADWGLRDGFLQTEANISFTNKTSVLLLRDVKLWAKGDVLIDDAQLSTLNAESFLFIGDTDVGGGEVPFEGLGLLINDADNVDGTKTGGVLRIRNGGRLQTPGSAVIGSKEDSYGHVVVEGAGSSWVDTIEIFVGYEGTGTLTVSNGASVTSQSGRVGNIPFNNSIVDLVGADAVWTNTRGLTVNGGTLNSSDQSFLNVGDAAEDSAVAGNLTISRRTTGGVTGQDAIFTILAGGLVNVDGSAVLGDGVNELGVAEINGLGSTLNLQGDLTVGGGNSAGIGVFRSGSATAISVGDGVGAGGSGLMLISDADNKTGAGTGGHVRVNQGSLLDYGGTVSIAAPDEFGYVTVAGRDAEMRIGGDLVMGQAGKADLRVNNNGKILIAGTTILGPNGTAYVDGGTLDFGNMSFADYAKISAVGGTLIGGLIVDGFTDVSSLPGQVFDHASIDTTGVNFANRGTLFGSVTTTLGLENASSAQTLVARNERLSFGGELDNAGQVVGFGGELVIGRAAVNQAGGRIEGRGLFTATGGWTNRGGFNFFGGFAIVSGDALIESGASVFSHDQADTTFSDNVVNNGVIRTDADSQVRILGTASGIGSYTGTGLVTFVGELSPGNSTASVSFDGDVALVQSALLTIEIGGRVKGAGYDHLDIAGDFDPQGATLLMATIANFDLRGTDEFEIVTYGGELKSQFNPFSQGIDGYISHRDNDKGGGSVFFTPILVIPEPSSLALLGLGGLVAMRRRRG